ncbi:hypothetical protein ACN0QP_002802 [Escherichia coli]|uniref:hypothetical protein n=1 Tax=Escherichia coli TaxID=562 RepID=UPI000F99DC50|nr:hypothetical protein [Escherichia coli]HDQ6810815.1 hypothetical protein [Escherichia coli O174:H8]EED0639391.1 hypothetical protein [Escherichia coli]EEQ8306655.1 hypothetical protein [Escherichia coli]EEQ9918538.1 hypothetical protein [Escherichia coli]EER6265350.1 hypothetical protein [Escherichia coli]
MIIVIPFPQWGKSINRNDVRYGCLDGLRGHYDHSASDLNQNFSLKNDVGQVIRKAQNHVDF